MSVANIPLLDTEITQILKSNPVLKGLLKSVELLTREIFNFGMNLISTDGNISGGGEGSDDELELTNLEYAKFTAVIPKTGLLNIYSVVVYPSTDTFNFDISYGLYDDNTNSSSYTGTNTTHDKSATANRLAKLLGFGDVEVTKGQYLIVHFKNQDATTIQLHNILCEYIRIGEA